MFKRLHAVVETPEFLRKSQGLLSDEERAALVDWLAAHPTAGDLIVGTGGARKLRWAAKGKGARVAVRGPSLTTVGLAYRCFCSRCSPNKLKRT